MAVLDIFSDKEIQGALAVGAVDNLLVYLIENGIVLTGKRKVVLDLARVGELVGGYMYKDNPFGKGALVASIPLAMHSGRYFVEGLIKGYGRPHVTYTPPSAPSYLSSSVSVTSY
jgi:hypothetical protein